MLARVVFVIVDAHNDREAIALGRSGNDNLLRARSDVALRFFHVGEQTGGFDDEVHAERFPREFGRRLGADDLDFLAVDHEDIVFGFVGSGFLGADFAFEATLDGVVFDQVSEVVGGNDIPDRDDFDVFTDETLFDQRPEDQAANTAEPIDCYFHCHNSISVQVKGG